MVDGKERDDLMAIAPLKQPKLKPAGSIRPPATSRRELPDFIPIPEDPLDSVSYTTDIEKNCVVELEAVAKSFRDRMAIEQARVNDTLDTERTITIVCDTRRQKNELLRKLGLFEYGDKYIDVLDVAKALGVTLSTDKPRKWPKAKKPDQKLAELAVNPTFGT